MSYAQSLRLPILASQTMPGMSASAGLKDQLLTDAESGEAPSNGSQSKRVPRPAEEAEIVRNRGRWKIALYGLAAFACGVLM